MITARARRTDPSTSHAAARKAERFADSHVGRILAAFNSGGLWTALKLATHTGLTVVQVDRRLHEMPQIERVGASMSGFTVWQLRDSFPADADSGNKHFGTTVCGQENAQSVLQRTER